MLAVRLENWLLYGNATRYMIVKQAGIGRNPPDCGKRRASMIALAAVSILPWSASFTFQARQ